MNRSPYREEPQRQIKSLSELMAPAQQSADRMKREIDDHLERSIISTLIAPKKRVGPRNERDELFDFFYAKVAPAWLAYTKKPLRKAYLAMKISHLKDRDLFFLKSDCLDAERRGQIFSKVFWGSLKPRPEDVHTIPDRRG